MYKLLFGTTSVKTTIPFKRQHDSNKSETSVSTFRDTLIVIPSPISNIVNTIRSLGVFTSEDIEFIRYLDSETLVNLIFEYNSVLTHRLALYKLNMYK